MLFLLTLCFLMCSKEFGSRVKRYENYLYPLIYVMIVLIFSFRDLGLDLENYRGFYYGTELLSSISDTSFSYSFELGWKSVIFLLKILGLPFEAFLFFSISIPCVILYYLSRKVTREVSPFYVLLIFLIFVSWEAVDIIRAFFSSSLILLSIYLWSERRRLFSLVIFFASILFHSSAIIAPIIVLLARVKLSQRSFWFILFFVIIASLLFRIVFWHDLNNIPIDNRDGSFIEDLLFKINYYVFYYQDHGYSFNNQMHEFLTLSKNAVTFGVYFFVFTISLEMKNVEDRFISLSAMVFIISFLICVPLYTVGLYVISNRIISLMTLSVIFILGKYYSCGGYGGLSKVVLSFLIFTRMVLYLMYHAGFHHPMSPFYLVI